MVVSLDELMHILMELTQKNEVAKTNSKEEMQNRVKQSLNFKMTEMRSRLRVSR